MVLRICKTTVLEKTIQALSKQTLGFASGACIIVLSIRLFPIENLVSSLANGRQMEPRLYKIC
jgi:hypothetical protein